MLSPLFTWHTKSIEVSEFELGLQQALASGAQSLLILSCSKNNYPIADISSLISASNIPIFGGIYPMITIGETLHEQGTLIVAFSIKVTVSNFINVAEKSQKITLLEQEIEQNNSLKSHQNFLMFYDGLMENAETFIETLYECLDHEITIAGGGGGNLAFIQRPCIFTNQGVQSNIVQLVALPETLHIGVDHGWEILTGPFLVSEATDHVVESLNYIPALTLYKETVESLSNYRFNKQEFFDIAKNFPLGIAGINGEILVRDPIVAHKSSLQCVGNVPVNSMIYILKGRVEHLITSAKHAALTATEQSTMYAHSTTILFDCISRVLYMNDNFSDELSEIVKATHSKNVFGAISIGEIANDKSGAIRLLNKSTVVGCM